MRNIVKNVIHLGLFGMVLIFNSCQEEFEEVNGGNDQETISASSTTANLIKDTSTNDGSFDNIVDGASCFAINFPYTVEVAGVQISIDSREDLDLIEEIFDEFDDDEDILDILFPVTITFGDFTEITIESRAALGELIAECTEGNDDDIECIDFIYPISLFTFDINEQQTGSVTINSDRELRRFFEGLEDNDLVSIDFPITLQRFDGTQVMVNNNTELAVALESARNECDEDDDNDFDDDDCDDCSADRVRESLVECSPWIIVEFERDDNDLISDFRTAELFFDAEGGLTIEQNGTQFEGGYELSGDGNDIDFSITGLDLVELNLDWQLNEVDFDDEYKEIDLSAGDDNELELKSSCNGESDNGGDNADTLRAILNECEWIIRRVENQGEEINRLLGYKFEFMANGTVTLSNGINTSEGTWEVGLNEDMEQSLLIAIGEEGSINFNWPLEDLSDERLSFEAEEIDYELILQRTCDDDAGDGDVSEIRDSLLGDQWNVVLYDDEGDDETANYAGLDFSFSLFNQIEVSINDDPQIGGLWRITRDATGNLQLYLNFADDGIYEELTEPWFVIEASANRIELVFEDEEVNFKTLVFEKKM